MAINPRPNLPPRNACFVSMTGFGKSQGVKNTVPESGVRHVLWDPDEDHKAYRYEDKVKFIDAVKSACIENRTGKGFRVAWSGRVDVKTFEWWCEVVWTMLNGKKLTYITIEELADVSESAGKASPWWGQINRKCRKYGGILNWTTQRSQEVSKTAYSQAAIKYIGYPNDGANIKDLARMVGVKESDLLDLKPLEFYRREHINTEKVKFNYKK